MENVKLLWNENNNARDHFFLAKKIRRSKYAFLIFLPLENACVPQAEKKIITVMSITRWHDVGLHLLHFFDGRDPHHCQKNSRSRKNLRRIMKIARILFFARVLKNVLLKNDVMKRGKIKEGQIIFLKCLPFAIPIISVGKCKPFLWHKISVFKKSAP